ncbi:LacI family DNA-binding transcriptional regulator [Caulobacter hibisci]|uniref:LacI family DNA-binding transcriptional regulator n=1 Tax=Caulobacter hibisci TaxID=2035993 RepID=A0ABS0T574_9CAUL|nr:LacI family DNA-binding transcriptional regulator [Caulobacter hibisci]MBI1687032.1 LacI family DNA-binding transcriptional regulator [Caulobacter hibisci]
MNERTERTRRRSSQSATIRDVAALAGVSPMTVSRVINRESTVKEETRALVEAAIAELNYAPNPAARSLAGSAPFRIGLLYDNPSTGYLSEFLVGALDESSRTGSQIVIEKCAEPELAGATLARLLKTGVDGLILPPPLCESQTVLAEVKAAGAAAVAVAPGMASSDMATIRIDNEAAAFELTQHLLSLGHKRFGFIKGHPNQTVSQQRMDGFMTALKAAGIPLEDVRIEQGFFTYRSGLEAAERLLNVKDRPTAIFAANDDMAAATAGLAHRLGLDVPGDVSIVGFDDTSIAANIWPALTTVHQPIAAMARAAVDLVLEEIRRHRDGTGEPRQLMHPHTLIVRASTGPAPQ